MKRHNRKLPAIHLLFVAINLLVFTSIHTTAARNIRNANNNPTKPKSAGILVIVSNNVNITKIYNSFYEFQQIFDVKLPADKQLTFENGEDLRTLIQQLESPKYSTIIYVLNDEKINRHPLKSLNKTGISNKHNVETFENDFSGYCDVVSTEFSFLYNKTIILWPCPKMKKTEKFLPSYETIAYAVKSTAKEFNWTEALIFATETVGIPLCLAIAANLHIPYRIEIGVENIEYLNFKDSNDKVIVVCSPLNSPTTSKIIDQYKNYQHTKILLIDIVGNIFNHENEIYSKFNSNDYSNLLVLTILTEKFKYILNSKYHVEFSGYLSGRVNSDECDYQTLMLERKQVYLENSTICIIELMRHCNETGNATAIENLCKLNANNSIAKQTASDEKFSKQFLFSEYFNLFDFITSMWKNNLNNQTNISYQFDFIVLDFRNILSSLNESIINWRPFMILQHNKLHRDQFIMHHAITEDISWITNPTIKLVKCGYLCWTIVAASILLIMFIIIVSSLSAGIALRNYFLKKRLSKGPNKIVLAASDFVFPVDSRRVDEGIEAMLCCWLQQLQEFGGPEVVDKPDLLKGSYGSLKNLGLPNAKNTSGSGSLVRHNTTADCRARYQGDLVQLKEIHIPHGSTVELKTKAMDHLIAAHGLRHENINPLLGWLSDPNRTALVFEHCSRGSLQDVLIMDEIKLDWSFRLSLLTDLVRGMRYLHASSLRVHGSLSSRNCVVDARWVLKITDYGMLAFYEAQGLTMPSKSAKELLWTAPEALRGTKGYPKYGTPAADVFSFGIIMQEVVVRGEPYCMLSLSPEEIITKIKRPPPLIRPSVSKGAAPPEAINIMRQCWAENPEMRPDFNDIGEKFKQLNHGRKVNFVDTMFQMLEKYSNNLEELIRERTEQLDIERKKTEQLLNRMLPSSVAEKLKLGLAVDPEEFSEVTIYFSDIVGFTTIAAHCTPFQVVDLLNDLYTCFDATINAYNVYKVETIGDAYMVVGGVPTPRTDHAEQIATMALDLLHQSGKFKVRHLPGVPLQLRIGLHTGPCCAGVVGLTMPRYCLFGDTVNTASRMESTGSSWRIHMSQETCDRLEAAGSYIIESRGPIEIKGKGKMNTYWLLGKKGFDKELPTPPAIGKSHGLDETLIKRSILISEQENQLVAIPCTTVANSTSVTGNATDVKVEITPPVAIAPTAFPENTSTPTSISVQNSYSVDSTNSILCSEIISKSQTPSLAQSLAPSPQARKFSEIPMTNEASNFLNPISNFNRLNPSPPNTNSARLFKRIEEMIDLSSPYNHYRCLSPSETNLSQGASVFMMESKLQNANSKQQSESGNKPGSSRLLRRQFSLDKDDGSNSNQAKFLNLETISSLVESAKISNNFPGKAQYQPLIPLPGLMNQITKSSKQQSTSLAQDLEKIEEIPASPANGANHNSVNNLDNLNCVNKKDTNDFNMNMDAVDLR